VIGLPDRFITTTFFAPIARTFAGFHGNTTIPVLMYHSVSNEPETEAHPYFWLNTTPEHFEAQMRFLKENHYDVISLAHAVELLYGAGNTSGKDASYAVITFDDGFRDFFLNAFPILQKYGFTATVFLPTDYITDHTKKMSNKDHLSWDEVAGLIKQGITFGSHTAKHPQLKNLNRDEMRFEISHSREVMENRLGVPVEAFSYPFAFPEEDGELVKYLEDTLYACGYRYGVSTRIGRASAKDPIFFLKRLPVNSRDDIAFLQAKLEGGYDWLHGVQFTSKIVRAKLWNDNSRN
jgi:peptidoglycan/xylan/chitin deacetylase (PgdA/CDA1 family)